MGLFRRNRPPPPAPLAEDWHADGAWLKWAPPQNAIREGHRQEAIAGLCGGLCDEGYLIPVTVVLSREPGNPHDTNAVMAHVMGVHVGYLDADLAQLYSPGMDRARIRSWMVPGVIRGGSTNADRFGVHVWLDRATDPRLCAEFDDDEWFVPWPPGEWEAGRCRRELGRP